MVDNTPALVIVTLPVAALTVIPVPAALVNTPLLAMVNLSSPAAVVNVIPLLAAMVSVSVPVSATMLV